VTAASERAPRRARTGRRAAPVPAAAPRRRPAAHWTFAPFTPERWPDFAALFGEKGACAGCWCTWARLGSAEFRATPPAARRALIRRRAAAGTPPGLLAYEDGRAVGWIAVAPREEYPRLATSRVMAPVDGAPVWSVPCFFVDRAARGRGLTVALLKAACAFAAAHGATAVEGYPVDARGARLAPAFAWFGLAGAFAAAGFREVARRSPTRPLMRRRVRAPRGRSGRG
jgi:GNAT superfamily N-acetyltransferase